MVPKRGWNISLRKRSNLRIKLSLRSPSNCVEARDFQEIIKTKRVKKSTYNEILAAVETLYISFDLIFSKSTSFSPKSLSISLKILPYLEFTSSRYRSKMDKLKSRERTFCINILRTEFLGILPTCWCRTSSTGCWC